MTTYEVNFSEDVEVVGRRTEKEASDAYAEMSAQDILDAIDAPVQEGQAAFSTLEEARAYANKYVAKYDEQDQRGMHMVRVVVAEISEITEDEDGEPEYTAVEFVTPKGTVSAR